MSVRNARGAAVTSRALRLGAWCAITLAITPLALHARDAETRDRKDVTGIVEAADGSLYVSTRYGGKSQLGGIYRRTRAGGFNLIYTFEPEKGIYPLGLIVGWDGELYGTTANGGDEGLGTAFRITRDGKLTVLHSFTTAEGGSPSAGLTAAADGNFYGVTGGVYARDATSGALSATNYGAVYQLSPKGSFRLMHEFQGHDGAQPATALVQATDGNLYGTTSELKAVVSPHSQNLSWGTVYRMSTKGLFTTVYKFTGMADAGNPRGRLLESIDGTIYGTTSFAGEWTHPGLDATLYRVRKDGTYAKLATFALGSKVGEVPLGGVTPGWFGVYGVTQQGGARGAGTLYRYSWLGTVEVLHAFEADNCGAPVIPLVRGTSALYGATEHCLFRTGEDGRVAILERF